MKKILLFLFIIFMATTVHAERWIECVDTTIGTVSYDRPIRREGDCFKLGLCSGLNNTGLSVNAFSVIGTEWSDAGQSNKKCDLVQSPGSRIVALTAQELSDIADYRQTTNINNTRSIASNEVDVFTIEGVEIRSIIELHNKRDNYIISRLIELQNRVQAMIDSSGPADSMRAAGAAVSTSTTDTRTRPIAVNEYKNTIDTGGADN